MCRFMLVSVIIYLLIICYDNGLGSDAQFLKNGNSSSSNFVLSFPHHVLQTKATGISLSSDIQRWRKNCIRLNQDHNFDMFDDAMLLSFTKVHYPQYLQLFQALSGVYMADMARVLLVYHFGGLYMDLDFHCHRSFTCLYRLIKQQITTILRQQEDRVEGISSPSSPSPDASLSTDRAQGSLPLSILPLLENKNSYENNTKESHSSTTMMHVLVVSREPLIHAELIHHRPRCVIQDFYLATPRHPFLKWMLDSINDRFLQELQQKRNNTFHENTNKGKNMSKGSASIAKSGPFSYSIERYLNQYYFNLTKPNATYSHPHNSDSTMKKTIKTSSGFEIYVDELQQPQLAVRRLIDRHHHHPQHSQDKLIDKSQGESVVKSHPHHHRDHVEIIYEMPSEVIHPLIDASNSNLYQGCESILSAKRHVKGDDINTKRLIEACRRLQDKKYLTSTKDTMMAHMWTHSYLSFSFLRGWYDYNTYRYVEKRLEATNVCNV